MNPEFLINALRKTLQEFFTAFENKVTNVQFHVCCTIYRNSPNDTEMKEEMITPFKNKEFCKRIHDLIQERDINLFEIESNNVVLFEKIDIKEWYPKLQEADKELVWTYLKSLFQISSMLAKR